MLVFSIGISFLFRLCIKKNISFLFSCLIILIICCFPAWLLWSVKPRGGYVTAFTCSCILLYIFQTIQPTIKSLILVSILLSISIHSQILISIPIAFCFLYWVISEKKNKYCVYALLFLLLNLVIIKLPGLMNESYWKPPMSLQFHWSNISTVLSALPRVAAGSYFYELTFPLGKYVSRLVSTYLLIGFIISIILFFRTDRKSKSLMIMLLIGGLVSFMAISFMGGVFRYTLGLFTSILFIFFLSFIQLAKEKKGMTTSIILLMMLISVGSACMLKSIPAFWVCPQKNDMALYDELIDHLKNNNVQNVYVLDPMLQWQLNYSGFSSRSTSKKERIDRYTDQVNECYHDSTCKVALVGYTGYFNYSDPQNDWDSKVTIVNERFFVYEGPEDRHLKAGGFE
jgi:hypothetical protein